jgi:hypothetical protein
MVEPNVNPLISQTEEKKRPSLKLPNDLDIPNPSGALSQSASKPM